MKFIIVISYVWNGFGNIFPIKFSEKLEVIGNTYEFQLNK